MGDFPVVQADPAVTGARVCSARLGPPLAVVSVFAAVALVVLGFVFAGSSATQEFGVPVAYRTIGFPWAQLAATVDWAGEPAGAVVVLGTLVIVFLRRGNPGAAVLAVAGPGAAVAVTMVMKPLVGRTINTGFLSFPSGHTAFATAVALVTMLVVTRKAWLTAVVTVVAGASMAWAQVLLNAHYPTDTIGGFCAALAIVPAVAWVVDRTAARRSGGTPA